MRLDINPKNLRDWSKGKARRLWQIFTQRIWLKVISLILAIIVWNYVISSDTSITRTKILYNINGSVTGVSTLSTYGLALLSDPAELLENFTVRMDVAQSQYSYVTNENVRVSLDLSGIRNAGTQDVPLTGITSYGRVVSIVPASVTVTVEALDSRPVPVAVDFQNVKDGRWCNLSKTNPSTITISGASSVVRRIARAQVTCDVSDADSGFTQAMQYSLLDDEGNEINQDMLTRSASSVTIEAEVWPMKEIPVSTAIDDVVTGHVDDNFEITQVTIQPETIKVAAESELLDSITEVKIDPVDVEGASQTFTAKAKTSLLSDFRYASAEEVYVTVNIESKDSGTFCDINGLDLIGLEEGLTAQYSTAGKRAWVTGTQTAMEACATNGITLSCDVSGLEEGVHDCVMTVDEGKFPGLTIVPESDKIEITITKDSEE